MAPVGDARYVDRRMDPPRHDPDAGGPVQAAVAALSGRAGGPGLPPPEGLGVVVDRLVAEVGRHSTRLGHGVLVDPVALLVARARLDGLRRRGPFNCGGSARLMPAADGWVVANLARPDDWDLVDAWIQPSSPIRRGRWDAVVAEVARHATEALVERAVLVGLPAAGVGERALATPSSPAPASDLPTASRLHGVRARRVHDGTTPGALGDLLVVDLSALWAGPLACALLQWAGCRVVKVESERRPDGARLGSPGFYSMLNGGKASVSLDLDSPLGRRRLDALVARADVVVTAARPRALEQLGLVADEWVGRAGTRVWLSITGYGTEAGSARRVAFGDDAAAAGGLVVWDERGPCFCGDAIADPLSGLAGASAVLAALGQGGGWTVDVAMADVAAGCASGRPGTGTGAGAGAEDDRAGAEDDRAGAGGVDGVAHRSWAASRWPGSPPPVHGLGADTERVLAVLGIG